MTDQPAPRRNPKPPELPIACDGCGFTLGWLVRLQTELAIVRNPRSRLVLLAPERKWELRCPQCGTHWSGPGDGFGGAFLVA